MIAPLWPFKAVNSVRETLVWRTNVIRYFEGEQSKSLSDMRQTIEYEHFFDRSTYARGRALLENTPIGEFTVPLWFSQADCQVSPDGLTVTVSPDVDFGDVGAAIAVESSQGLFVGEIASTSGFDITLTTALPLGLTNTRAMPAIQAVSTNGLSVGRIHGQAGFGTIEFIAFDPIIEPETPFQQYLGLDFLDDPVVSQPLEEVVQLPNELIDAGGFGPITLEPVRGLLDQRHTIDLFDSSLALQRRRKRWLNTLRGRDRPFWYSARAGDLILAEPYSSGSGFIRVEAVEPNELDYIGRHLYIDGELRQITAAIAVSGIHQLTISPINRNIDVPAVSYVRRVRLDSDTIQIDHQPGDISTLTLPLIEVPE